jgi:predicted O-methyltransferase YrrM
MAITTREEIDRIENINRFWVQVRYAKVVEEDGVEIARTFTRKAWAADSDYSDQTAEVKGVCDAVFTDKCKTDYAAYLTEAEKSIAPIEVTE